MFSHTDLILSTADSFVGPLLIGLVGSGGLMGAIVAFIRLAGDRSNASVAQAQGASDALERVLEATERERDYWKGRYEDCHSRASNLAAELTRQRTGGNPDANPP